MPPVTMGKCYLCSVPLYSVVLALYLAVTTVIFVGLGYDAVAGDYPAQFFADSLTYIDEWQGGYWAAWEDLVGIGHNFLAPWVILSAVGGSLIGVFVINIAVFLTTLLIVFRVFPVNRTLLVLILCANPMTLSSLILVNKEILALLSMSLFAAYIQLRRSGWLFAAIALGFVVRWEMGLYVLAAWGMIVTSDLFRQRALALLIAVATLTLAGLALDEMVSTVFERALLGVEEEEGTGLYPWLNSIQREYGYIWVAIPKMLHLAFGLLWKIQKISDWTDFYNNVIVMTFVLSLMILAVTLVIRKRARIRDTLFFAAIIYWMFIAFAPIYAPRYLYPLYFMFAVIVSRRDAYASVRPPLGQKVMVVPQS